jgi:hypothetical protein
MESDKRGADPCSRPAKMARIHLDDHTGDAEAVCPPCSIVPPLGSLPDDILYHLFNGRCSDGTFIFPPECRWVLALVCWRWRSVIASITHADAKTASSRLRDALWDGPPPEKTHHHSIVRASGMALMAQYGLSTDDISMWITVSPASMDVIAVLMASGVPDRVDEANLLADRLPKLRDEWSNHIHRLEPYTGQYGPFEQRACRGYNNRMHHMLLAVAAGSWRDIDALISVMQSREPCCVAIAALHAARRNRVDVVRALLLLIRPDDKYGNMRLICNVLNGMWLLVGQYGLVAVGDFLVGLEQGRDPAIRFTAEERQELARVRDDTDYDNGWNWMAEAAKHNRIECLDLFERHGLYKGVPNIAVGVAAVRRHIDFYDRIKAYAPSSLLEAAVCCIQWEAADMHPRALSWIVGQPEFDLPHDPRYRKYSLGQLFEYASKENVSDVEILRAIAIIAQRWPDFYECQRGLPRLGDCYYDPDFIGICQEAVDRLLASYGPYDPPPEIRDDIETFLAMRHGQRAAQPEQGQTQV